MALVFFINPIGASKVDPGRIEFKSGANPFTTPFFFGDFGVSSMAALIFFISGPIFSSIFDFTWALLEKRDGELNGTMGSDHPNIQTKLTGLPHTIEVGDVRAVTEAASSSQNSL